MMSDQSRQKCPCWKLESKRELSCLTEVQKDIVKDPGWKNIKTCRVKARTAKQRHATLSADMSKYYIDLFANGPFRFTPSYKQEAAGKLSRQRYLTLSGKQQLHEVVPADESIWMNKYEKFKKIHMVKAHLKQVWRAKMAPVLIQLEHEELCWLKLKVFTADSIQKIIWDYKLQIIN